MSLAAADFQFVSEMARRTAAIVIEKGKEYLVESRLEPVALREGFTSLTEMLRSLRAGGRVDLLQEKIVDALTTNETLFFRDPSAFEGLRKIIFPLLITQRASARRLRIWSGACSSGQEPYSIAMMLRESFPELVSWSIEIVATDLSPTILARAKKGVYSQIEVTRGLPAPYLAKYFRPDNPVDVTSSASPTGSRSPVMASWAIADEIKKMVQFREMNLVQSWPVMAPFDLILMRNVMIYFDVETKKTILKKLRHCLASHGHLILGSTETTVNIDSAWKPVAVDKAAAYQVV